MAFSNHLDNAFQPNMAVIFQHRTLVNPGKDIHES